MRRPRATALAARVPRLGYGRLVGAVLLLALLTLDALPELPGVVALRFAWFDFCQWAAPRVRHEESAVIVDVDGRSLARHGQWPWPRTLLADLVERIAAQRPAAIGFDFVMPEPDRLSPDRLPALLPSIDRDLAARLAALPSNDAVLAAALRGRPVVLGVAGVEGGPEPGRARPGRTAPVRIVGRDPLPFLPGFERALRSVDDVDRAAAGHGLLNVELEGGAVRRVPLVGRVGPLLIPAFALELFRVAAGAPGFTVTVGVDGIAGVQVGDLVLPTERDGRVWLRYGPPIEERLVSAADVLAGAVEADVFEGQLVLIGVTALGLSDRRRIAGGGFREGVEIHAELIESIFDGTLLSRPDWAPLAEALFLLGGGLLIVLVVPVRRTRATLAVLLPLLALAGLGSLALFRWHDLLLDAATPALRLLALFTVMLGVTLVEAERQRRALRRQVERQREAAARLEGELSAARRIQMGILPRAVDVLAGETRVDLEMMLEPAREVGGDLYDVFRLDADRLFFLLGDVSGKGLPGSLFMAVSKALYKSAALRRGAGVAAMMREANDEISRDNPEALFVTAFAAVLDLPSGVLEYCNAGHDPPYLLPAGGGVSARLGGAAGPPLCVLEGFPYEVERCVLAPGEAVFLFTDGVTEALSATGEIYGRGRLEAVLAGLPAGATAAAAVAAIREDVGRFAAGAEPADDVAVMVLRWRGPSATGR